MGILNRGHGCAKPAAAHSCQIEKMLECRGPIDVVGI